MQVMPGSSCSVVDDAKDLNPLRVRLFRYNGAPSQGAAARQRSDCRRSGCRRGSAATLTLPSGTPDPGQPGGCRARPRRPGCSATTQAVAQDEQLLALWSVRESMPVAWILSSRASSSAWSRETGGVGVGCQGPVTTVPSPADDGVRFGFFGFRRMARFGHPGQLRHQARASAR